MDNKIVITFNENQKYGFGKAEFYDSRNNKIGIVSEDERYFQDKVLDGHCELLIETDDQNSWNAIELTKKENPDIINIIHNLFCVEDQEDIIKLDDRKVTELTEAQQIKYIVDLSEKNGNIKQILTPKTSQRTSPQAAKLDDSQ
jgi:hypothetical protein